MNYINKTKSHNTINNKINAIIKFLKMVSEDTKPNINFEEIDRHRKPKAEVKKNARSLKPLSINEIVKIRNVLLKNEDYYRLYIFEMFYQNGLDLHEIIECTGETYNFEKKCFEISNRQIPLHDSILDLLHKDVKILRDKERRIATYETNISEIGRNIDRQEGLVWKDIIRTRELYFFTCSICKTDFPNTPEHLALITFEGDAYKTKWIVCKGCAIKGDLVNE